MDMVLSSQGIIMEEVVDAIKPELDEHSIGEGYNIKLLMEFFKVQSNKMIDQITADVDSCKERMHILSCTFFTLGVANSKENKVPTLKPLQTFHFSHLKYRGDKFRDLQNLMNSLERTAMMKGTWRSNG
eukprot:1566959-Ditylum_brightwellii.AAC.1